MPAPVTHDDILANTAVTHGPLVPEIRLHLLDESGPWSASGLSLFADDGPQPYWAFAWGSGQALARYLLDHPEAVAGLRVFDFGTGSGIAAIAAAMCDAKGVLGSEIDPAACKAAEMNAALNGVKIQTTVKPFEGSMLEGVDVLLAADAFFHWPGNESVLMGDLGLERVLVATPPRRDFARGCGVPANRLRMLAEYEVKAYPDLEPGYIKTSVVHELVNV